MCVCLLQVPYADMWVALDGEALFPHAGMDPSARPTLDVYAALEAISPAERCRG